MSLYRKPQVPGLELEVNQLQSDVEELQAQDLDVYYQGVTTEKFYDSASQTHYYITEIPVTDEDGNTIVLKRGFAGNTPCDGSRCTAREFAEAHNATVVLNASIFNTSTFVPQGVQISGGTIYNSDNSSTYRYILGIKNNHLVCYAPQTEASTILADGCNEALTGFIPLYLNGSAVSDSILQGYRAYNEKHPRQVIAEKIDGSFLVFTTDGRGVLNNAGMALSEIIELLNGWNIKTAYLLDGGGSTQTVVRNTLVNQSIDDNGYTEREVCDFLYFSKEKNTKKDITYTEKEIGYLTKELDDFKVDMDVKLKTGTFKPLCYYADQYMIQRGSYTLIGDTVICLIDMRINGASTTSSEAAVTISNLPYACNADAQNNGQVSVLFAGLNSGINLVGHSFIARGGLTFNIYKTLSNGNIDTVKMSDITTDDFLVRAMCIYQK